MRTLLYRLGTTAASHPLRVVLLWLVARRRCPRRPRRVGRRADELLRHPRRGVAASRST